MYTLKVEEINLKNSKLDEISFIPLHSLAYVLTQIRGFMGKGKILRDAHKIVAEKLKFY